MSSSNIHSTVNSTSSSSVAPPPLPSVFELLAQERLSDLIRPCLQQVLKFLHELRPISNVLRILYKYKDEFILLIESIVQWLYLHYYSALVGEHFYGMKRTANHQLRSLIFSVFLPYVKLKLDSLHNEMRTNNNNNPARFHMILQLLPKIQVFIEGVCWLYRLGYAFGRTEYYSPALQLAGVKLTYTKDPAPVVASTTTSSRFFSAISQIMSSGLFLIQFIDWWNSASGSKKNSILSSIIPPLPTTVQTQPTIGKRQCPLCRQPCNVPTAVRGSGYVYCNTCITDYVKRYQRCPTTQQPVTSEQLIKIY
jgi:peroxin-12